MEGDRAFAQAHDHHVASGLDPLGDGDFAFAAEQFDRAHFAQVHAHRIIGALAGGELLVAGAGVLGRALALAIIIIIVIIVGDDILCLAVLAFGLGFGVLVALDDLHTHLAQGGLNVLDLIGAHLARGQRFVELVISDIAALLRLADQLLNRSLV